MKKIVFFNIPAHGHTNPTLSIVKKLIEDGNEVKYYSFDSFKEKIEETGAKYVSCDMYLDEETNMLIKEVGSNAAKMPMALMNLGIAMRENIKKNL